MERSGQRGLQPEQGAVDSVTPEEDDLSDAEWLKSTPTSTDAALYSAPLGSNNTSNSVENMPESLRADQSQQPTEGEKQARSSGSVSRQFAKELSPEREPLIYGQGFHSESEVRRQREKLIEIARGKGILLDAEEEARIRRDAEAFDEGQEHEVFFAGDEWVTKITKKDSWAAGAAPAQYFARWADLGTLFPKLEPQVIGVLPDGRIVVRQEFIKGTTFDSVSSLQSAMEANGWEKLDGSKYRHRETKAIISDARPPNVIRDDEGGVWPFDVVVHDVGTNEINLNRQSLYSSPATPDQQAV